MESNSQPDGTKPLHEDFWKLLNHDWKEDKEYDEHIINHGFGKPKEGCRWCERRGRGV